MINKVDHLIDGGRGDDFYRELFREKMMDLCEKHSSMREQGVRFVSTVTDLMKRLLEYRAIMRDENQENKMSCTVNLLVRLAAGRRAQRQRCSDGSQAACVCVCVCACACAYQRACVLVVKIYAAEWWAMISCCNAEYSSLKFRLVISEF